VIVHVLLIKPRDGSTDEERAELVGAAERLGSVPDVRNFSFGRDFSGRSRGYEYAAVMYFDARDALQAYADDAMHREIVAVFERLGAERLVVDYETGTSGSST
jgi:hypothetical protein